MALAVLAVSVAPLSTPYWWDAGAVYAPGAKWLAEHGFDARPGVFPDDLSRGHPPFYYLLLAAAFRLGGPGPVPGHVIALASGWAAVVATHALGRELWGRAAGAVAALLLASAPLFLTMSSEALPEAPLTALTAMTFLALARGNMLACAALGSILVLVKETGLACPAAIACALAIEAVRARKLRGAVGAIGLALVPAGVVGAFLIYQRAATGWFVTPYHAALFAEDHALIGQLWRVVRSIVVDDGRVVAVAGAVVVVAIRWRAPRRPEEEDANRKATRSLVLLAFAVDAILSIGFFTRGFYLERYTLPLHVCAAVVLGGLLAGGSGSALRAKLPGIAVAALAVAVAVSRRDAGVGMTSGETSFRYLHAVHAYSAVYRRLEAEGGAPVILTGWPITDALRQPFLGWVSRPFQALEVDQVPPHKRADLVLAVPGLGSYKSLVARAEALGFHRVDVSREGAASMELWGP